MIMLMLSFSMSKSGDAVDSISISSDEDKVVYFVLHHRRRVYSLRRQHTDYNHREELGVSPRLLLYPAASVANCYDEVLSHVLSTSNVTYYERSM